MTPSECLPSRSEHRASHATPRAEIAPEASHVPPEIAYGQYLSVSQGGREAAEVNQRYPHLHHG